MCVDATSSARRKESIVLNEIDNSFPLSIRNHSKKFYDDIEKNKDKFLRWQKS